jgi:hypothetical protein
MRGRALPLLIAAALVAGGLVAAQRAQPAIACTPDSGSTSFSLSSSTVSWTIGAPPWTALVGTPSLVFSGTADWGNTGFNGGGTCVNAATGLSVGVVMAATAAGTANPGRSIARNEFSVTCADPGGTSAGAQALGTTYAACETFPGFNTSANVSWNTTLTFALTPDPSIGADTYNGSISIIAQHT